MSFDFDSIVTRRGTGTAKHDLFPTVFKENLDAELSDPDDKRDFIPAWVADMEFSVAPCIADALRERLKDPVVLGYSVHPPEYFVELSEWFRRRHGLHLGFDDQLAGDNFRKPELSTRNPCADRASSTGDNTSTHERARVARSWIVDVPSAVSAVAAIVAGVCTEPRDKILLFTPAYYPFFTISEKHNRQLVHIPLLLKNDKYSFDWEAVEEATRDPCVKCFINCNPHNPVGLVAAREDLERLGKLCVDNNIFVISDEVWADLVLPSSVSKHVMFPTLSKRLRDNSATVVSLSKAFNLAGVHQAAIIVSDKHRRKVIKNEVQKTGYFGPNAFSTPAFLAAFLDGEPWLNACLLYVESNMRRVREFFEDFRTDEGDLLVSVLMPDATYNLWTDWRRFCALHEVNFEELSKIILNRSRVVLDPGEVFGEPGQQFPRINVACPRAMLEEILARLQPVLRADPGSL